MTRASSVVLALAVTAACASPAHAQTAEQPVHAIVNVELIPADMDADSRMLVERMRQVRRDPALSTATLIRQDGASNYFIIDVTFASAVAYKTFVQSPATRSLRNALYPHLGNPWDERLGSNFRR